MASIQEILANQRKKSKIKIDKLSLLLYGEEGIEYMKKGYVKKLFPHNFNLFNQSRVDIIKESIKQFPGYHEFASTYDEVPSLLYLMNASLQSPTTLHVTMFISCIQYLGTQTQQIQWRQKASRYEIIGCYAQTQLGHGSDVQNLETTSTYMMDKDEFLINTPSISAAKYWPGDLGIFATHALVFAKLIVHGVNYGIHPFIVPIRDPITFQVLPGIQTGDIGPKIGFNAKDNGYLLLHNIRIPKRNMLRKFISVSKRGEIKTKGDPKVSYAAMMIIRQTISCIMPKLYGFAIIIAARYSLYRTQFLDIYKKQIPIIEYQTQKEKIITRIAEYYAVIISGNAIKRISVQNLRLVREQNNFRLMNETHICLCLGKAFFSETVYQGMEICQRACGGHGFSYYSGFPTLLSEYSSNLTYEGQNTILYLQIARFILKNYKYHVTKKKQVGESVSYLNEYEILMQKTIKNDINWNLEDLRILIGQTVCFLIGQLTKKIMNKPEGYSDQEVWNQSAGIDAKKLGVAHSIYYTFNNFKIAIQTNNSQCNRQILQDLGRLYGIHVILNLTPMIAEAGFLNSHHIESLKSIKRQLLDKIRPMMIALTDSFFIPEHLVKSEFTYGNPYQNYLKSARQCQLNKMPEVLQSAKQTRIKVNQAILKHQSKL